MTYIALNSPTWTYWDSLWPDCLTSVCWAFLNTPLIFSPSFQDPPKSPSMVSWFGIFSFPFDRQIIQRSRLTNIYWKTPWWNVPKCIFTKYLLFLAIVLFLQTLLHNSCYHMSSSIHTPWKIKKQISNVHVITFCSLKSGIFVQSFSSTNC